MEGSLVLRRPSAFGSRGHRKQGTFESVPDESREEEEEVKKAVAEERSRETSIISSRHPREDLEGSSDAD